MWRHLKLFIKKFVYRPRLVKMGEGSLVLLPRKIINPRAIEIGARTIIYHDAVLFAISSYEGVSLAGRIVIGNDVYIGKHAQLLAMNTLTLGDGTVLSEYVYINDTAHGFDPKKGFIMRQPMASKGAITIGKNCFLGVGVTIMPGVKLGDWTIVGARSVVTKSFPTYSMIGGTPAKLIKRYSTAHDMWIDVNRTSTVSSI